jgi:ATP-binding protein involved in chromosome partitioning
MSHLKTRNTNAVESRMKKIKHKIAIISGKGGVGKSLVTTNLAIALASEERQGKIGILDADLTGPCIPKMMGMKEKKMELGTLGILPPVGPKNVKVVSMDFLLPSDEDPVIWRGLLKMGAITQFLSEIDWGSLDYLLVDLPPGTGDESLSLLQLLPEMDGVVIVTIPSEVSQIVVKKAVTFANKMNVPILGIIENMSGMMCPHCGELINIFSEGGGARVADQMEVNFLGSIPMDPTISVASDKGIPFILSYPDSFASISFKNIVKKIKTLIEEEK